MCERLAQRLEEEKKDYESATLCYMCSPNGESLRGGVYVCVHVCVLVHFIITIALLIPLFDRSHDVTK